MVHPVCRSAGLVRGRTVTFVDALLEPLLHAIEERRVLARVAPVARLVPADLALEPARGHADRDLLGPEHDDPRPDARALLHSLHVIRCAGDVHALERAPGAVGFLERQALFGDRLGDTI